MEDRDMADDPDDAPRKGRARPKQRNRRKPSYVAQSLETQKVRECLMCHCEFLSWGPGNRRCPECDERLRNTCTRSSRDTPVKTGMGGRHLR